MIGDLTARAFCGLVGLDRRAANIYCGELLTGVGYVVGYNLMMALGPGAFELGFSIGVFLLYALTARFMSAFAVELAVEPFSSAYDFTWGVAGGIVLGFGALIVHWLT